MENWRTKKFKALSDESRIKIIQLLRKNPLCVNELMGQLKIPQSLLSHHLKILRDANLVENTRSGKKIIYRLSKGVIKSSTSKKMNLGCCRIELNEL